MKAFIVAGTHSGAGKTSLTIGIIRALKNRGLRVQPFKVGPDFIDPSHHTLAAGHISRNLDGWMLSKQANIETFMKSCKDADVAVIEGVAGLFDGYDGKSERGSTAEMAKWLGVNVFLVTDAWALSRSIGAIVKGYDTFDPVFHLGGVIFNKVNSQGHYNMLKESVLLNTKVPVLGYVSQSKSVEIEERHLGLFMPEGDNLTDAHIESLATLVEDHIDLDLLLEHASEPTLTSITTAHKSEKKARIAVFKDAAFCFYYQDNLDLLEEFGAEIVYTSPLTDNFPDNIDGIYIGGGYPELYAPKLAQNKEFLKQLKLFIEENKPVYAECGGLMYLSQGVIDFDGHTYDLVKAFPFWTQMNKTVKLSYVDVCTNKPSLYVPENTQMKGHVFHFSDITQEKEEIPTMYSLTAFNEKIFKEGYVYKNTLASYVHLHFKSNPLFAKAFVETCGGNQ